MYEDCIVWLVGMRYVSEPIADAIISQTSWNQRLYIDALLQGHHPSFDVAIQEFLTRSRSSIRFCLGDMQIGTETQINLERPIWLIGAIRDPIDRLIEMYPEESRGISFPRFVQMQDECGRYPRNAQLLHLTGTRNINEALEVISQRYLALVPYRSINVLVASLFPKTNRSKSFSTDTEASTYGAARYAPSDQEKQFVKRYHKHDDELHQHLLLRPKLPRNNNHT